jgi:hypothetical protein
MTPWALGLIPTVRIGAGAWRKLANTRESGDTDQANTPIHGAQTTTQEQKEKRKDPFKKQTRKQNQAKKPTHARSENSPLARATPLHSVALRATSIC